MTIKFKSQATGDLLMLQASAEALLQVIGKTAAAPGVLVPQDMPGALQLLKDLPEPGSPPPTEDGAEREGIELPFPDEAVSLRQRSWPLIRMIEQALAEDKPIVWGV